MLLMVVLLCVVLVEDVGSHIRGVVGEDHFGGQCWWWWWSSRAETRERMGESVFEEMLYRGGAQRAHPRNPRISRNMVITEREGGEWPVLPEGALAVLGRFPAGFLVLRHPLRTELAVCYVESRTATVMLDSLSHAPPKSHSPRSAG